MADLIRYQQHELARRVQRGMQESREKIQYTAEATDEVVRELSRVHAQVVCTTVSTLVGANALIQAATLAGIPPQQLAQLAQTQELYLEAMHRVEAAGAQQLIRVLADLPELPPASLLDKLDRLLTG